MAYENKGDWKRTMIGEPTAVEAPTAESEYKSAQDFGADYSIGGKFIDFFTGSNAEAENVANNYNTALTNAWNANEAEKTRNYESSEAEKARNFEAQQAEITRNWQEQMSNTSIQRMMNDAKAAGINPLYLVGNAGASTPSGATASGVKASGATASGSKPSDQKSSKKGGGSNAAATALAIAKIFALVAAA